MMTPEQRQHRHCQPLQGEDWLLRCSGNSVPERAYTQGGRAGHACHAKWHRSCHVQLARYARDPPAGEERACVQSCIWT